MTTGRPSLQSILRERRKSLGIPQCDLAARLRISRPLMCRWEREVDTPSVGRFLQWIDALGLDWALTPKDQAK